MSKETHKDKINWASLKNINVYIDLFNNFKKVVFPDPFGPNITVFSP